MLLSLIKYKVSLSVVFTAITAYLIFDLSIDVNFVFMALGVFVLASGASALNQFQESSYDAKMRRTCKRVIPSGKLHSARGLAIAMVLIAAGLMLLYYAGYICFWLGVFNIFWYNIVYTYFKRITPYAVIPGSIVGAVPVFIGWAAAGGHLLDFRILLLGFFMFIWQVPHFWLLLLKYHDDYEQAGFPTFSSRISNESLKRIIFSWILATSATSLMFPYFGLLNSWPVCALMILLNFWFVFSFARLAFPLYRIIPAKGLFIKINIYTCLTLIILLLDAV